MEDFEKGLMLAGLISPGNVNELNERMELEKYEKDLKEQKSKVYFRRAVLAAEIVSKLHEEPTFGRIKFQKLVYLCEHIAEMDLQKRYSKFAAGPFDNKFMHGIKTEFERQKWFRIDEIFDGKMKRSKFTPLENCNKYKTYYEAYFDEIDNSIKYVIDLFRKQKTDFTEIAATLFFCFLEINEKGESFTEEKLLSIFYAWSKEKNRFDEKTVLNAWNWLKEKDLVKIEDN
jgi:hypothetical protein